MGRTRTPGAISTHGARPLLFARVKISISPPDAASRFATSTMYTFMPPASPVPGWSRGDVWTERVATRRGRLLPCVRTTDDTLLHAVATQSGANRHNRRTPANLPARQDPYV